jgi:hypothetical protein
MLSFSLGALPAWTRLLPLSSIPNPARELVLRKSRRSDLWFILSAPVEDLVLLTL